MASLIKSQIVKHLSKFARNITADQIDVKILSGKGELKNIELNELVLTEVLELPTWLQIRRAHCNSVIIIVPWTGLRTTPIKLFIDEIQVEVALTADPPVPSGTNPLSTFGDNSYGFANRVVEGMSLYINMVEIHFDSGSFGGSFMLSRLCVESRSPAWLRIRDLRASRITDSVTNQVLMFKQLSWELLRVEAFAHAEHSQRTNISASLRLITNSGKGRFTIKKSTVDGSVLDGKIEIILDDILWIATLPQVRSAIAFYSHILNLIKAAPPKPRTVRHVGIVKTQAANKLTPTSNLASKAFKNFDFEQTSMHLYVGKIDLHLCDDTSATSGFPVDWNIESGALQVTLIRLSIDFYPANVACSDRTSWNRYTVPNECSTWNKKIVDAHLARLCSHLDANAQTRLKRIWPQLLSQNYVLRIYDVIVQCVTDANSKRDGLLNLFMSDRKSKASLPSDQPLIHLELASFYHRATENMPTMPNTVHLLVAPFILLWDQRTIRWVAFVIQDISSAVQNAGAAFDVDDIPNSNVRIDFLMPKVVIPLCSSLINDHRYPQRLLISMSTVLITNCGSLHSEDSSSFFKSLSSNLLDLVNKMEVNVNRVSFRNFIIHLNDTIADSEDDERFWISTSPVWVDTDNGEGTQFTPFFGDVAFHAVVQLSPNQINIAVQPQCRLRVFLDHFQLVQVTRLLSSVSLFVDQMEADRKFFTGKDDNSSSTIPIAVVVVVEQAQVNLLLFNEAIQNPYINANVLTAACSSSSTESENVEDKNAQPENQTIPTSTQIEKKEQQLPMINPLLNDFEQFPEFPQAGDFDSGANLDETMSIATNISDDDQRFLVVETPEDDVFAAPSAAIAVAEEALIVEEQIKTDKRQQEELAKHVNVLEALLTSVNVLVSVVNGNTFAEGCASGLQLKEHFDQSRTNIYSSSAWKRDEVKTVSPPISSDDCVFPLKFELFSPTDGRVPSIRLQVQGLDATLSETIVEHLSPFVVDNDKVVKPFYLNVNVLNSKVMIKNSNGTPPLRLSIRDVLIEQGEEDEKFKACGDCG